ncbi:MAG: hypothetical protein VX951_01090 [Planctomycetota bacterium]|nr:hypothetical protein [Planctomycetota bacterium]
MKILSILIVLTAFVPCRFTVRDVGFVDLGDPAYKLHVFVSGQESPAAKATLGRLCKAQLRDVNVEVEFVDPDAEKELPAHRLLREMQIQEFPSMVLVHPDGQAMKIGFQGTFDDVVAPAIESVASSPLRTRIRERVLRCYCVVVLVEGLDEAENRRAAQSVRDAFAVIERGFDAMPKAVGDLPSLLTVTAQECQREQVLLWSLGVGVQPETASVGVLFGRGRRIGPILDGADISKDPLLGILANAGESCECGLDRTWMRGPRIPLRWDDDVKQQATKLLGFDPENPVVKSEISGILSKRPKGNRGARDSTPTVAELLAGYSEAPVEDATPVANGSRAEVDALGPDEADTTLWVPVLVTAGVMFVVSLLVAAFVFMRRTGR